jgi:hypothetical protein
MRTASRAVIPTPEILRQRLAHPEWFHIQEKGGATNLSLNVFRIPVPERSLVASVTSVATENRNVSMIFGQRLPGASQMHGALCVQMSVQGVSQAIYSSPEFLSELDTFAERHGIEPKIRVLDGSNYPAERVVMERASVASISFSDDETEVRFYRTSALDMRMLMTEKAGKADLVHPVVEVLMATAELVQLVHALKLAVPPGGAPP